ncbi:MAG: hypothetical protein KatS3mg109_0606 [Pirellulaceae bacterium]|nr:MAG: hypothetical protein KatS3mg109_0606 [Pirellulaceae bacterium]
MSLLARIERGRTPKPPRILVYGTEGIGKAQPVTAKVLTPTGFVEMGQLRVGDQVIGSDGRPYSILGVYPQGVKEVFRVTFRDGSTTECCDDHLWFTTTETERARGFGGAVRTLRDIRKSLRCGTRFNHAVPRVRPIAFEARSLPIDPWLLGVYLGDGHSGTSAVITNPEADIQDRVRATVAAQGDQVHLYDGMHMRLVSSDRTGTAFMAALAQLGLAEAVAENKFVPPAYLLSSVNQRLELLRGLIDSDGYVTNPGAVEYSTVSLQLAHDFCFLVRSLGGSARIVTKRGAYTKNGTRHDCQLVYRIFASFPPGITPVASAKHRAKWREATWRILHTIRNVESVGRKECQCIRVDAPDSLYVTDDFILTHNSTFASQAPRPIFVQTEDGLDEIPCDKFPLAVDYDDVVAALVELRTASHDYETIVIDSLDWLERLIWDKLCAQYGVNSIEKVDGGYARGYTHALAFWREVIEHLSELRLQRGMVVLLIAHSKVERFEDPESTAYDRYSPRLHKHAASLICEWCDAVLFATRRFRTQTEDAGFGRTRTVAQPIGRDGGERILRCVGGPACVAKNRYGIAEELPLSWNDFYQALVNAPQKQGANAYG